MLKYRLAFCSLFLNLITYPLYALELSDNYQGKWKGIEVMGADKELSNKIRTVLPFKIGAPFYMSKSEEYKAQCIKEVQRVAPNYKAKCGYIIFGNGEVYADVEFDTAEITSVKYRKIPKSFKSLQPIPKELAVLYQQLEDRMNNQAEMSHFPIEKYDSGFIDFADPVLHEIAVKISNIAYDSNQILLDRVIYSEDDEDRAISSDLLSWSQHPENLDVILDQDLLFDPYLGVRNNIARSFIFLLNKHTNQETLRRLIPNYCKMATLPTHHDRNKALYSIFELLEDNPNFVAELDEECLRNIHYIADMSILANSGGIAKKILVQISSHYEKNSNHNA